MGYYLRSVRFCTYIQFAVAYHPLNRLWEMVYNGADWA